MSTLEQSIKENTAAIRELTAALYSCPVYSKDNPPPGVFANPNKGVSAPSPTTGGIAPCAVELNPTNNEQAKLEYERDVKPLGLRLIAKDRVIFNELLSSLGAKKGTDLTPEQWPTFIAKSKEALGE